MYPMIPFVGKCDFTVAKRLSERAPMLSTSKCHGLGPVKIIRADESRDNNIRKASDAAVLVECADDASIVLNWRHYMPHAADPLDLNGNLRAEHRNGRFGKRDRLCACIQAACHRRLVGIGMTVRAI